MKSLANSSNSNPPSPPSSTTSSTEPQKVKMVLLGDSQVGKSGLVNSYTTLRAFAQQQQQSKNNNSNISSSSNGSDRSKKNCNPGGGLNNLHNSRQGSATKLKAPFADYYVTLTVDDKDFELSLWDTNSSAEYEHIRPLNFAKTEIFLLCFSVTQTSSLENVAAKWVPEIKSSFPAQGGGNKKAAEPMRLLVGLQTDMREEQWQAYDKGKRVTKEQALQVAREIGAVDYVECSARTGEGVEDVFLAALNAVIYPQLHDNSNKHAEKINLRGSGGANLDEDYSKDVDILDNNAGTAGGGHKKRRCVIS